MLIDRNYDNEGDGVDVHDNNKIGPVDFYCPPQNNTCTQHHHNRYLFMQDELRSRLLVLFTEGEAKISKS